MKIRTLLSAAFAIIIIFGASSCKEECQECSANCMDCDVLGITTEICADDYATIDEYDLAIQAASLFGTCTNTGSIDEICEDDYDSKEAYDAAIAAAEAAGSTCTEK